MPITLAGRPPTVSTSGNQRRPPQATEEQLNALRYRVTTKRPLMVRSEADERKGTAVCDLMPGESGVVPTMGGALLDALLTSRKHALVVVYSEAATPFSRCRAMCRLLLQAGHNTLHPLRCRRLRGGLIGWRRSGGEVETVPSDGTR